MLHIKSFLKFRKFILIPLILIFLMQILLFTQSVNQNVNELEALCPLEISEIVSLKNIDSDKLNYINEEISIFPQYENLLCLGKIKQFTIKNQENNIYFYSSNNFYELFNYLATVFIFLYFIQKKRLGLYFIFLSIFNLFNILIFYKPGILSALYIKYLFIYLISIFLFILIDNKNEELKIFDYATIVLVLLLFSNYQLFSNFLLLYFLIFYMTNDLTKTSNIEKYQNLIFFTPVLFFLLRFLLSFNIIFINYWRTLSQDVMKSYKIFGDMQLTLNTLNCNYLDTYTVFQDFKYLNTTHTCPFLTGYPLIDQVSFIFFDSIWVSTLIISIMLIASLILVYKKILNDSREHNFYLFLIFISPPFNFLIERMNIDLFIFLLMFYVVNSKLNILIKSFIVIFTTFLKIFTFPFHFSYLLISSLNKDTKKIINHLVFSILAAAFLIDNTMNVYENYQITTNNPQKGWDLYLQVPSLSFGMLSTSNYLSSITNFVSRDILLTIFVALVIMSTLYNSIYSKSIEKYFASPKFSEQIIFIPVLCLLMLFENFDYRLIFLVMVLNLILYLNIRFLNFVFLFLIISSGTNYYIGNFVIDLLNIFAQMITLSFLTMLYFKSIKSYKLLFKSH